MARGCRPIQMGVGASPIVGSAQRGMDHQEGACLCEGRRARRDLREDRTRSYNYLFTMNQGTDRVEKRNAEGCHRLDRSVMPKMAVRASRVIGGTVVMPV